MYVAMHFAAAAQVLLRLEFSAQWTVNSDQLEICSCPLLTAHCYLLYSSTISCSLMGRLMSLRLGRESTRPVRVSKFISSQTGTGFCDAYCAPCSTINNFLALSRMAISSPAFTW